MNKKAWSIAVLLYVVLAVAAGILWWCSREENTESTDEEALLLEELVANMDIYPTEAQTAAIFTKLTQGESGFFRGYDQYDFDLDNLYVSQPFPVYLAEYNISSGYNYLVYEGNHFVARVSVLKSELLSDETPLISGVRYAPQSSNVCLLYDKLLEDGKAVSFIVINDIYSVVYQEGCDPIRWQPDYLAGEESSWTAEELESYDRFEKRVITLRPISDFLE